ncbi:hypothetical protein HMPREF9630_01741 [Peptoanaerobacter stomatis]|uniref:ABC-2 family transporter protein n=1 Tax=Peptoanaerobacter stomatis TaxID=796937 RepID=V9HUW3_9FIRM|nr:hypothetical protein [Peptoanaerobacter stomatis]EHL17058.1 hypothetical protein HMPREF9630_01741 [Peptoanaerobacter stomatis]
MKFFIFTLKSKIKLMPVLCAIMLIFMGSFYIITLNSKNKVINLEIYFDEQDSKNNMIIGLINGTASTKSNLSLSISYDLQSSQSKLEDGDIDVLIKVPANFYNSILNSENKSATIYFSPYLNETEKGIFTSLTKSSADILSYAQANIYVSDSIMDSNMSSRNYELNRYFLNEVLNREDEFETVKSEKDNNLIIIYITLLISSIIFANSKSKNYIDVYAHLIVKGYNLLVINILEILSNTIIFAFITGLILFFQKIPLNAILFLKLMLINMFIASLTEFIAIVFKEGASFCILILCIVSTLSSGLLLPRFSIFLNAYVTPVNLIMANTLISYSIFALYTIILILLVYFKIYRNFRY